MDYEGPITLIQTASGPAYEAMIDATEIAHRVFCAVNRVGMARYVGVRRGSWCWQAAFNRIEMLNDLRDNFGGWVMYLDADAVIRQPEFDLRRFLGKRNEYGLVICPGHPEAEPWEVNDGVFFINLGRPTGREISRRWHKAFHEQVSDADLEAAAEPFSLATDDQHMLQMILRDDPDLMAATLLESPMTMNHRGAKFVRQFLRAHGTHEERLGWIKDAVAGFAC